MGQTTPNLGLYKPGGGSTGVITPDEAVDIDKINDNFDKIDDFAGRGLTAARLRGIKADRELYTPPVKGIQWYETDTGKVYLSSSTGTWRQYEGVSTAPFSAWTITAGTAPAAFYAIKSFDVDIPTQMEADELIEFSTISAGSGYGWASLANAANGSGKVTLTIRQFQLHSTITQSLTFAWRLIAR